MATMNVGAVAVDLGATSARFASGRMADGRIEYEIIEQVPHKPYERDGHVFWDVDALLELCQRAWSYAESHFDSATLGIDSWGVDHGFVGSDGKLVQAPVAYRDLTHQKMFEDMADVRANLYRWTGIQHQPFNTIYQLAARKREGLEPTTWLFMPDLLGYLLTGKVHCEYTMASTSQLMGLDDSWSPMAFQTIGWPIPEVPISRPGKVLSEGKVRLVSVGSHDTASAVFGLGLMDAHQAFLNVGTWSLLGALCDRPILSDDGFTNERTVDGRVRYLANIPGFYVINRVHEELGVREPVPDWLSHARFDPAWTYRDLTSPEFFNPESMLRSLAGNMAIENAQEWAGFSLGSLVETTSAQLQRLARATERKFQEIRVSGGGSRSELFCQRLSDRTGMCVMAGPEEATLLGNLAVQFVASGALQTFEEAANTVRASFETRPYEPCSANQ